MHLSNTANEKNGLRRDMIFRHNTLFCANLSKEYYGKFSNQTNYGTNHAKRSNHDVLPIWNQMVSQAFFFSSAWESQPLKIFMRWITGWFEWEKGLRASCQTNRKCFYQRTLEIQISFRRKDKSQFYEKKKKSLRDFSDTWKSLNADDKILLNTESWQWCISRDKNAAK